MLKIGGGAATGTVVDAWLNFETGLDGDDLTNANLAASMVGGSNLSWDDSNLGVSGSAEISTAATIQLPAPVDIGGTVYDDAAGTRSCLFSGVGQPNFFEGSFTVRPSILVYGFWLKLPTNLNWSTQDFFIVNHFLGGFAGIQGYLNGSGPYVQMRLHMDDSPGTIALANVAGGTTVWVTGVMEDGGNTAATLYDTVGNILGVEASFTDSGTGGDNHLIKIGSSNSSTLTDSFWFDDMVFVEGDASAYPLIPPTV